MNHIIVIEYDIWLPFLLFIDSIEKSLGRKLDSIIEGKTVGNLDCFNKEWSYFPNLTYLRVVIFTASNNSHLVTKPAMSKS